MIKAEELRINNWVKHEGKYKQIAMVESNGKSEHFIKFKNELSGPKTKCDDIEPIILNSEIEKQLNGLEIPMDESMNAFTLKIVAVNTYKITLSNYDYYLEYKYLHQIQNFYFSLSHQELQITL